MLGNSFSGRERLLHYGSLESQNEETNRCTLFKSLANEFTRSWNQFKGFSSKVIVMGRNDPRKIMHAIKMGLALAMVSLLVFWKQPFPDVAQYSIWAMLTVIVMFEFSIGATFIKGFNRGLGTFFAAVLAFGFGELALASGKWEEVVIVVSIFVIAVIGSYLKLYPGMAPYEYGYRVFVLTYCILMMAGNRTSAYTEAALTRLMLIALGAGVCLVINICIYPIWSGEDLHNLVAKNFKDLATSLEGCVNGYLSCVEYERIPSRILSYQPSDEPLYNGYRAVVESTTRENTLLGFAIWEPPHGRYKMMNYPWRYYVKVSGTLRHCAFMVMALHGSLLSEIQAPPEKRKVFQDELRRVGEEGAKVLREIGIKIENMEKLNADDILIEVHKAAENLQKKIDQKSYLLVKSERWEIVGSHPQELINIQEHCNEEESTDVRISFTSDSETLVNETLVNGRSMPSLMSNFPGSELGNDDLRKLIRWPSCFSLEGGTIPGDDEVKTYESASSLSLATYASLLIEFVARLQNLVHAFEELSEKAEFKDPTSQTSEKTNTGFCSQLVKLFKCKK